MLVVQVLVAGRWLLVPTSMLSRASMAFAPRACITSTPRVSVVCAASAVDYWPVVAPPSSLLFADRVRFGPGRTLATVRHGLVPRPEGVTLYRVTNGGGHFRVKPRLRPAVLKPPPRACRAHRMCARVARSQPGVLSAGSGEALAQARHRV